MRPQVIGLLCLAMLTAASCGSVVASGQAVPEKSVSLTASELKAGLHGLLHYESKAVWIKDAQLLAEYYRGIERNILGTDTRPPTLDFSKEGVLFISMGSRATAGYQISLASKAVIVKNGIAEVKITWIEPESGGITAQVLTSPYLMLRLPRTGLKCIRLVDQNYKIRAEIITE